jgi:hypothetical protein
VQDKAVLVSGRWLYAAVGCRALDTTTVDFLCVCVVAVDQVCACGIMSSCVQCTVGCKHWHIAESIS